MNLANIYKTVVNEYASDLCQLVDFINMIQPNNYYNSLSLLVAV